MLAAIRILKLRLIAVGTVHALDRTVLTAGVG